MVTLLFIMTRKQVLEEWVFILNVSKNSDYVNLKQQIEAMKKNYSNFEINLKKDIKEMIEETINEKIKYLIENTMEKFANKMEKKLEQIWDQIKMQKEINELQKSQIFISRV